MASNQRALILTKLVPILKASHPDGNVSNSELMEACHAAGLPNVAAAVARGNHWLTSRKLARGRYDLSTFYTMEIPQEDPETGELDEDALAAVDTRSDSEVDRDVRERFSALDTLAHGVISGAFRALILSGPPGVGKSYPLEKMLAGERERVGCTCTGIGRETGEKCNRPNHFLYERVSGFSRATGLYRTLWQFRESDAVVLLDDLEGIWQDEAALSLLKSACDTSRTRYISWRSESSMADESGELLPRTFEFQGRVIVVTNLDFEGRARLEKGTGPHLQALLSRSYYVDLNLTTRELFSRVLDVATEVLRGCSAADRERILSYIREKAGVMRELSIRTVIKARQILEQSKTDAAFRRTCDLTLVSRRLK